MPDLPKASPPQNTGLSWGQRAIRGVVLLGAVAALALIVVLPETDGSTALETAQPTTTTTSPAPIARAEPLQDAALTAPVQISLEPSSSLVAMQLRSNEVRAGTPADAPHKFEAAVSAVVDEAVTPEPSETTPTTAWEEPPLPPESEWVDTGNGVAVPDILLRIRFCESTNNYNAANSGSSARGAYQFLIKSWDWYGHAAITGLDEAHLATPAQQDEAALRTLQAQGTGPWAESRPCWNDPDLDPRYATAKPPVADTEDNARPTTTTTTTTVPGEGDTTDGSSTSEADPDDAGAGAQDGDTAGDPDTADTPDTTVSDSNPDSTTTTTDGSAGQDQ